MSNVITIKPATTTAAFTSAGAKQRIRNAIWFSQTDLPQGDLDAAVGEESARFNTWLSALTAQERVTAEAQTVIAMHKDFTTQMMAITKMARNGQIEAAIDASRSAAFVDITSQLNLAVERWKWSLV